MRWRRPARTRTVVVAAVAILAATFFVVGKRGSSPPRPAATFPQTGQLNIEAVDELVVGEDFRFKIDGAVANQTIRLTVDTGYESRTTSSTPAETTGIVTMPFFDGPASGTLLVTAIQQERLGTATFELKPTQAVDPVDVFLGPRTVVADNEHFVMEVAVPTDEFGNPVEAGTGVDFSVVRADQTTETFETDTSGLLASWVVYSHTVAGRSRISAQSGTAGAPERTFLEVAGIPAPYALTLIDPLVPADGHALVRLETDLLLDRFGNQLPDGAVVTLDAQGVTSTRRLTSQTIDGRAIFHLEVPGLAGSVTVQANASGVDSEPLTLQFPAAVSDVAAIATKTETTTLVTIGPVRVERGSYVPDGTVAVLTAPDTTVEVPLILGVGTVDLPADTDISGMTVEVLGAKSPVKPKP